MNGVWIIADIPLTAWELLSKGRELAGEAPVTAYLVGDETTGQETIFYGADVAKMMDLPESATWESYVDLVAAEAKREQPDVILVGADKRGKDFAAQLAAHLDTVCITDCKLLEVEGDHFIAERVVYGGLAVKRIDCPVPLVVTIGARTFEMHRDESHEGQVIKMETVPAKLEVLDRRPNPATSVNIEDADVVVGVGRGLSSLEDLKLAEGLAGILGGELGCTRAIAEELHWLPEDRYIGLSGKVIKPGLYLCAGISGQVQHVYGIRDAKTIVAIDKNEDAPICQVADYYIVGDLKEVLPALIEAISAAQ